MAEATELQQVSADRYRMRSHDLFDREWMQQLGTSQRFCETTSINSNEQQRAIVETTPREAKSDVATLTESIRQNNGMDASTLLMILGTAFGDNTMKYRTANANPPV